MSDLTEITKLVNSYAILLDKSDMEGVCNLFEHSTWRAEGTEMVLRGSAEVKPVYDALRVPEGGPQTRHLLTNLTVEVEEGATTASSHCYWTVLQNVKAGDPIFPLFAGQYTDKFEKVDGKWRFADRIITNDLTGDQSFQVFVNSSD